MLTVSYELRLACAVANANGAGDSRLATVLASACDEMQGAIAELRDLAHGIYPVILAEAGLGPAVVSLADEEPPPVELTELLIERTPGRT